MRDDFSDAAPGGAVGRDEVPLTDLQQAYLLGRERHLPLGGVAMQEFREHRGAIDVAALPPRLLRWPRGIRPCARISTHSAGFRGSHPSRPSTMTRSTCAACRRQ